MEKARLSRLPLPDFLRTAEEGGPVAQVSRAAAGSYALCLGRGVRRAVRIHSPMSKKEKTACGNAFSCFVVPSCCWRP